MPWRGPDYDGEFPSLGWGILEWAEAHLVVPDGPLAGRPLRLSDEQTRILVRFYGLDDAGRFVVRRAAVRRPQGWGKSPLLAVVALAELAGPSRFDGWDASGEPVGVRPITPWVQVAAVSEDQTDNTYAAAYAMVQESELAESLIDVGLSRMFLRGEIGRIEPVTSSAGTRLGQRITFAVLDETHLWTRRNGGHKLAGTIRRNASKMSGRTFESTNAHALGEDSVAERTYKAAQTGAAGLLYDAQEPVWTPEQPIDLGDRPAVLVALREAYGDSAAWVPLERIADEIADPGTDPSDAYRFYLNVVRPSGECPVDLATWEQLADPRGRPEPGSPVGLGFDGSISNDLTVLYGCTPDGYVFEVAAWERPLNDAEWRVPRLEVTATIREAFATWRVGFLFADPPRWFSEIEEWTVEHGADRVVVIDTNSPSRFAPLCDRFCTAVREHGVSHDGGVPLTQHLAATARKQVRLADDELDGRTPFVIVKADTRKIDRAVGAILALAAAETMPAVVEQPDPFFLWG